MRLAQLQQADRTCERQRDRGQIAWHGAHRGALDPRRQPPGARLRRRSGGSRRIALLHQLRLAEIHPSGRHEGRRVRGLSSPSAGATMTEERAILAGGCFWGVQELFRRYDGVVSTRVGYTSGTNANATYRNHGSHAEAVEIIFDPARISYRQILEFFFQIHDPSTRNR